MCKYIAVREDFTYRLPDSVSDDAGAMIEPLAVAVHATRRGDIGLGDSVLVIGAGAIGILVAALCHRSGAGKVLLTDRVDHRLSKACELAPILTANTAETDLHQAVRDTFGPNGPDKVFECVGLQETLNDAMALVRMGGLVTVIGIFEQPQATINASLFVSREIRVQGSQSYCFDFQTAIDLAPELRPERLITHTFPMSQLQQALDTAIDRQAQSVKIALRPDW
jgi:(R,R)-butanediol dehydrogenase/meso-butanediol dehydrogenase/diacetyl reductase/L-iditol 2-dehydrogenase